MHLRRLLTWTFPTLSPVVAETLSQLRNTDGITKKLDEGKPCSSSRRRAYCLVGPLALVLIGCAQIKKMALVTGVSSVTAGAASALGLATAPTALVTGVATGVASVIPVGAGRSKMKTGDTTLNNCAPDNFWSLLGALIETGGLLLLGVILVPMILGWILPGPLERKKKK